MGLGYRTIEEAFGKGMSLQEPIDFARLMQEYGCFSPGGDSIAVYALQKAACARGAVFAENVRDELRGLPTPQSPTPAVV